MCGQLALAEEALAPLGEEIAKRIRAGPYIQFDDTSVLVQAQEEKGQGSHDYQPPCFRGLLEGRLSETQRTTSLRASQPSWLDSTSAESPGNPGRFKLDYDGPSCAAGSSRISSKSQSHSRKSGASTSIVCLRKAMPPR
jgi:hypothetical protein